MPGIFDNIERQLLPALLETIWVANHADFCVGYFNRRSLKELDFIINYDIKYRMGQDFGEEENE